MHWRHAIRRAFDGVGTAFVTLLATALAPRRRSVRRSLWAGTPIISAATNARAERQLGVDARTLVYGTYFVTSDFDHDLSPWMKWPVVRSIVPYVVLLWAAFRFDRFHFFCDRGLLPSPDGRSIHRGELRLLRRIGREVWCWTYGADVRTREKTLSLGEPNACSECTDPGLHCVCDDTRGAANVREIVRHANGLLAMGDMQEYTPGSRNDLFFWPVDVHGPRAARYEPRFPEPATTAPLRVVHAPNHRHFKGTRYLVDAVERLRSEGIDVDLVLVEGLPNDEALAVYRSADVVFDQCLIGFHGYFALEAMAMGKPVLCYIRDPERYLIDPENCPIVNVRPETIAETLRSLANDRPRLQRLGRRGRDYVETNYSLAAFAERLRRLYSGETTDERDRRGDRGQRIHRPLADRPAA